MPLPYFPRMGQILVCDFSGFKEPEMVKPRPVIIVSPRLPYRSEIVAIVPISTSAPRHDLPFVVRLSKNYHPQEPDDHPCWAKCDMPVNIALRRLNGFKVGRRRWENPRASDADLAAVRRGVLHGLGMGHLLEHPERAICSPYPGYRALRPRRLGRLLGRAMTSSEQPRRKRQFVPEPRFGGALCFQWYFPCVNNFMSSDFDRSAWPKTCRFLKFRHPSQRPLPKGTVKVYIRKCRGNPATTLNSVAE